MKNTILMANNQVKNIRSSNAVSVKIRILFICLPAVGRFVYRIAVIKYIL